jgi:hypothetical protein
MSDLKNSFNETKLDLENPNGGEQRLDLTTVYPAIATGTPTDQANPGAPQPFYQKFIPSGTYLDSVKNLPGKSNLLNLNKAQINPEAASNSYSIFDATNLDLESGKVDGGIPYKKEKDPTVYPLTTQAKSPTHGFFSTKGQGANKFDQVFNPKNPYLGFIKKYT